MIWYQNILFRFNQFMVMVIKNLPVLIFVMVEMRMDSKNQKKQNYTQNGGAIAPPFLFKQILFFKS